MRNVTRMHAVNISTIVNVQQAKIVHIFKKTDYKLFKTNLPVLFYKICRINHPPPKHAHVNINGSNSQSTNLAYDRFTMRKLQREIAVTLVDGLNEVEK
jgi:hypothetical protein